MHSPHANFPPPQLNETYLSTPQNVFQYNSHYHPHHYIWKYFMVLQLTLQVLGKTWVVKHKLSGSSHYKHICCKACRLLNLIRHIVSPLKKRLYNSLVRSNSTYCSQLWRPQLVRTLWLKWVTKWFQRCLWRKDLTKMRDLTKMKDKNIKFWKFSLNRHTNGKLWA